MFGKLAVALLIVASPALAQDAAPADSTDSAAAEAPKVAYKTKRVCRSVQVVGSAIPRTTCTTKKIPIKPVEPESEDQAQGGGAPQPDSQN